MVVISDAPMLSSGVMQERVGAPSICTVQAPHSAIPHPNLVPVMPSTSRNTQRSGVSPSASMLCVFPLTLIVMAMASSFIGSRIGDREDGLDKGLRDFLRQVVSDAACDSAMRVFSGKLLRVGA